MASAAWRPQPFRSLHAMSTAADVPACVRRFRHHGGPHRHAGPHSVATSAARNPHGQLAPGRQHPSASSQSHPPWPAYAARAAKAEGGASLGSSGLLPPQGQEKAPGGDGLPTTGNGV